jgi:hypothetical protein
MDNNPFAPEHHQPGSHHQGHHQPHHEAPQPQPVPQQEIPPTPPPVPAFNQNFAPSPQSFTAQEPSQPSPTPEQPAYQQPWAPAPQTPQPQLFQPQPVAPSAAMPEPAELRPQPVVQVLSPRGVEYVFLTVTLFTGAIGLISALLVIVNGAAGFEALSFPIALLLVALPVFAWLFLRLKNAELRDPSLRLDASKRRSTQFIQIITFATCLFTLVGWVTSVFAKMGGDYGGSLLKSFANALVIFVVAGGILAYYWLDEHHS